MFAEGSPKPARVTLLRRALTLKTRAPSAGYDMGRSEVDQRGVEPLTPPVREMRNPSIGRIPSAQPGTQFLSTASIRTLLQRKTKGENWTTFKAALEQLVGILLVVG